MEFLGLDVVSFLFLFFLFSIFLSFFFFLICTVLVMLFRCWNDVMTDACEAMGAQKLVGFWDRWGNGVFIVIFLDFSSSCSTLLLLGRLWIALAKPSISIWREMNGVAKG